MSLIKSGSLTVFNGLVQRSVPLFISFLVSFFAGQELFAKFSFILITANTISAVCSLGIGQAILTSLSTTRYNHPDRLNLEIVHICLFILLLAVATFFISLIWQWYVGDVTAIQNIWVLSSLAVGIILNQAIQMVLYASGRYLFVTVLISIQASIMLLLCFINISQGNYENIILIYSSVVLISGLGQVLWVLKTSLKGSMKDIFHFGLVPIGNILKTQFPFIGYTLVWMLAIYGCMLLVATNYSVSDLAIYNLGYQWYSLVIIVPSLLGSVLIPFFVKNNDGKNKDNVIKISLLYAGGCVLLIIIFFICAPMILEMYNFEVNQANINIFLYMISAGCLTAICTPILQKFLALRKFVILYMISGTWLIIGLGGAWFFADSVFAVSQWFFVAYSAVFIIIFIGYFKLTPRRSNAEII